MKNQSKSAGRPETGGFTLVELLTVIAVIGILAATFLPALARLQPPTALDVCLNHQKQFAVAESAFAADHSDYIPSSNTRLNTGDGNWSWRIDPNLLVVPPTPSGQKFQNFGDDYGYTLGALFPYTKNPDIIHCPADSRYALGLYPAWCSYSMVENNNGNGFAANDKYHIYHIWQLKNPAGRMVINEENGPQRGGSYYENAGTWEPYKPINAPDAPNPKANPAFSQTVNGGPWGWYDAPAAFHLNKATFSMFDGHAEVRTWLGPDTQADSNSTDPGKYGNQYSGAASVANSLDRQDVSYVYSHIASPYWP